MLKDFGKRLPVSTRMTRIIMQNPRAMAEQGAGFMGEWGGGERYIEMAKMPMSARVCYYALQGGLQPEQIEVSTGLTSGEVQKGLSVLQGKGLYEATAEPI